MSTQLENYSCYSKLSKLTQLSQSCSSPNILISKFHLWRYSDPSPNHTNMLLFYHTFYISRHMGTYQESPMVYTFLPLLHHTYVVIRSISWVNCLSWEALLSRQPPTFWTSCETLI
jgi:hypothetical protein